MILGASGLLGRAVLEAALAAGKHEVHAVARRPLAGGAGSENGGAPTLHTLDLREDAAFAALLARLRPALVLNCAGIVKALCDDALEAILVNAAAPHRLARALAPWGGRLVQVSTDCVFSGRRGGYREEDEPDPQDLYGRSKLLGEVTEPPHLTVRSSFIGFEVGSCRGLLDWFLGQQGRVRGFRQAIWSGLSAPALARVLLELAERPEVRGLLHAASDAIDKHSLLHLIAHEFGKTDVRLEAVDSPSIDRSLDASRLRGLGIEVPTVAAMVAELAHTRQPAGEAAP